MTSAKRRCFGLVPGDHHSKNKTNDEKQIRKTTAMLKGFVKLAGKSSAAELAHKSGLLVRLQKRALFS